MFLGLGPVYVVRLSEGSCVLRGTLGCQATFLARYRAEASGSGRPSGASFRKGVRSIRKDACMDRVCAPDAFFFSHTIVFVRTTGIAASMNENGVLVRTQEPRISVRYAIPRLCTCKASVSQFNAIFNHILR